ncbi:MAG: hypothetical protein ACM31D_04650 [Bacteroidota bacterium]
MVNFLNSLVDLDATALQALVEHRVLCSPELASHPTVQVAVGLGAEHRVGFLGVVNGFYGTYDDGPKAGWGPISAIFDGGKLVGFRMTEGDEQ